RDAPQARSVAPARPRRHRAGPDTAGCRGRLRPGVVGSCSRTLVDLALTVLTCARVRRDGVRSGGTDNRHGGTCVLHTGVCGLVEAAAAPVPERVIPACRAQRARRTSTTNSHGPGDGHDAGRAVRRGMAGRPAAAQAAATAGRSRRTGAPGWARRAP